MQVATYISAQDYETLLGNKPESIKTVPAFMAEIVRKKAEFLRTTQRDGVPVVQQHERV